MRYRSANKPLRDIAQELGVDAVVEGTVSRSGDRVRVTANLLQASPERHLWAQSYERGLRDVFALQGELARAIADEIRIKMTAQEHARLAVARPLDPEVHEAYIKGRFYWGKRTEEDLKKAIQYFQAAIEKDRGYALAYDGLADCWLALGWYSYMPAKETFPLAKAAAMKALELDDSIAEAHTSLAFVNFYYDWNWSVAEQEFRRAIELNPSYANAHHWYADYLSALGRHEEAIAESEGARRLDPLSPIINSWVGWRYHFARQDNKAIEQCRKTLELDSNFAPAHMVLGQAYEQKGMYREAMTELEQAVRLSAGSPIFTASQAHAYGLAGRRGEAMKLIEELKNLAEHRYVSGYDFALAYSGLGDNDAVVAWLEKAFEERAPRLVFVNVQPRLDMLRSDQRFHDLLRRVNFPS